MSLLQLLPQLLPHLLVPAVEAHVDVVDDAAVLADQAERGQAPELTEKRVISKSIAFLNSKLQ